MCVTTSVIKLCMYSLCFSPDDKLRVKHCRYFTDKENETPPPPRLSDLTKATQLGKAEAQVGHGSDGKNSTVAYTQGSHMEGALVPHLLRVLGYLTCISMLFFRVTSWVGRKYKKAFENLAFFILGIFFKYITEQSNSFKCVGRAQSFKELMGTACDFLELCIFNCQILTNTSLGNCLIILSVKKKPSQPSSPTRKNIL